MPWHRPMYHPRSLVFAQISSESFLSPWTLRWIAYWCHGWDGLIHARVLQMTNQCSMATHATTTAMNTQLKAITITYYSNSHNCSVLFKDSHLRLLLSQTYTFHFLQCSRKKRKKWKNASFVNFDDILLKSYESLPGWYEQIYQNEATRSTKFLAASLFFSTKMAWWYNILWNSWLSMT